MTFEPSCLKDMTPQQIAIHWPNLHQENYRLTSEETIEYNCVAWITGVTNRWIDFYYTQDGDIEIDQSGKKYAEYFKTFGFEECNAGNLEEGVEKIAIYEDNRNEFTHVARQLADGKWTSKMGELEDIEHLNLEALADKLYGKPKIYMKRPREK